MARQTLALFLVLLLLAPGSVQAALPPGSLAADRGSTGLADASPGRAPVSVGNDGAARFSFPINVPPGTAGMHPELTLNYSSSARVGSFFGFGWNWSFDRVERRTRFGQPSYSATDVFVLGGQDLVGLATPGEFAKEIDTFEKIERVSGGFPWTTDPSGDTWEVTTRDGVVRRYGTTASGRIIDVGGTFAWLLEEIEDPRGNIVQIAYEIPIVGTSPVPSEIRYTLRRVGTGIQSISNNPALDRVVTFIREDRDEDRVSYASGRTRVQLLHRLKAIEVRAAGQLIRGYEFGYTPSADSGRDLLTSIELFGSDYDPLASPPQTTPFLWIFGYRDHGGAYSNQSGSWSLPSIDFVDGSGQDAGSRLGDIDGDGLVDLVRAVRDFGNSSADAGTGWYRNTGSGFAGFSALTFPTDLDSNEHTFLVKGNGVELVTDYSKGLQLLDVSRDGKSDLLYGAGTYSPDNLVPNPKQADRFQVFRRGTSSWSKVQEDQSTGSTLPYQPATGLRSFQFARVFAVGLFTPDIFHHDGTAALADLNGDGYVDLIKRYQYDDDFPGGGSGSFREYAFNRPGNPGVFQPPNGNRYTTGSLVSGFQIDVAGDVVDADRFGVRFFDINGDGLDDYAARGPSGPSEVRLNDGLEFRKNTSWAFAPRFDEGSNPVEDGGVRIVDANGDGKLDLVERDGGSNNRVLLGRESSSGTFATGPAALRAPTNIVDSSGADQGVRYGDFNRDGLQDVIQLRNGTRKLWINTGVVPDLLESVQVPQGGTVSISYKPEFADPLLPTQQVVDEIVVSDNAMPPTLGIQTFDYSSPGYDDIIRKFLGFGQIITTESEDRGSVVTVLRKRLTEYDQTRARLGFVTRRLVRDSADNPYEDTHFEYRADATAPYASLLSAIEIEQHDGNATGRVVRTEFAYDIDAGTGVYGNLVRRTELGEVGSGDADNRTSETVFAAPNLAKYIVDRPSRQQLWEGRAPDGVGGTLLQETRLHYDDSQGDVAALGAAPHLGLRKQETRMENVARSPSDPALDPTTTMDYDQYGNVVLITDPRANAGDYTGGTAIDYDQLETFPISRTNRLGQMEVFGYASPAICAQLHPNSPSYPAGAGLVQASYDPNQLAAARPRERCFDTFGRILRDELEDGQGVVVERTTWVYPSLTETWENGGGFRITISYSDGLGRTVETLTEGPQNELIQTKRAYDGLGRVIASVAPRFLTDPADLETTIAYDPLDRVVQRTLPGSSRVYTTDYRRYDTEPHFVETLPENRTKRRYLNSFGDIVRVEEVASVLVTTSYDHDGARQLKMITDLNGNQIIFGYDDIGRSTSVDDPDAGLTTNEYDVNGNLKKVERPKTGGGVNRTEFTYDALDRKKARLTNGIVDALWTYDGGLVVNGIGRVESRIDLGGEVQFTTYDLVGRPQNYKHMGTEIDELVTYDSLGQIESRWSGNTNLDYLFDDDQYLVGINLFNTTNEIAREVQWDARGRLLQWVAGNDFKTTHSYDTASTGRINAFEVKDSALAIVESATYGFDAADRLESIMDTHGPGRSYTYDALDRLKSADGPFGPAGATLSLHYGYDNIGNITCLGASAAPSGGSCAGGTALLYPQGPGVALPHAAVQVGADAATYEASGELKSLGTRTFDHSPQGQLVGVDDGGVGQIDVIYNGDGEIARYTDQVTGAVWNRVFSSLEWREPLTVGGNGRVRVNVTLAGQVIGTREFDWNPSGGCGALVPPSAPYSDPGGPLGHLVLWSLAILLLNAGIRLAQRGRLLEARPLVALGTSLAFLVWVMVPLGIVRPRAAWAVSVANMTYYHGDYLGSSLVVSDTVGTITHQTIYKPYGEPVHIGIGSQVPTYGFANGRFENEVDLYSLGARWYMPEMGRFLEPDPLFAQAHRSEGLHPYSYALNNPLKNTDSSGLVSAPVPTIGASDEQLAREHGDSNLILLDNTSSSPLQVASTDEAAEGVFIDIFFTPTPIEGTLHAFVIGTSTTTGAQFALRAGPSQGQTLANTGLVVENDTSGIGYGTLFGTARQFNPFFIDQPDLLRGEPIPVRHQPVGFVAIPFDEFVRRATVFTSFVNSQRFVYLIGTQNSNSFAFTFVRSLGFESISPAFQLAPGHQQDLRSGGVVDNGEFLFRSTE